MSDIAKSIASGPFRANGAAFDEAITSTSEWAEPGTEAAKPPNAAHVNSSK
jgi:hypothetical protein